MDAYKHITEQGNLDMFYLTLILKWKVLVVSTIC